MGGSILHSMVFRGCVGSELWRCFRFFRLILSLGMAGDCRLSTVQLCTN